MSMKIWVVLLTIVTGSLNAQAPNKAVWFDESLTFEARAEALINAMTLDEKITQAIDGSQPIPRLGVPEYNWWNESLHGVARNGRATVFPQAIGLAATFDEDLIFKVANAISDEARAKFNASLDIGNRGRYAGLTFWTPNVNIFRDPRWGRGQETYGEDPFLTSRIGVSFVRGLQGDDPKYLKAAACAKHYLVHSGPEELRHEFDAIASEKDIYETYLPAFEALVVEAKVEGVMGAYNRVLGEPACGSPRFLQKILREDWNFNGYVVSDCWAISDFHLYHKVTQTPEESAALALNSGVNLNCGNTYPHLKKSIEQGLTSEEVLDKSLKQLFLTRFRLGFFDKKSSVPFNKIGEEVVDSEKHRAIAREAAVKSIVLLKNNGNLLPLKKDLKSVYIVGPHASSEEVLLGNYYGLTSNTSTILDGIVSKVSTGTSINYKQGILAYRDNVNPIDWSTGEAKNSEVMVAVMGISGLYEGEEGEALASEDKGDRLTNIRLPQNQIDYVKKLKKDTDTPLVLILTGGSPIALPEIEELADAILFVWYPGEEGGNATADVLFGDANPSGKLPLTFPYSVDQLPPFEDYTMKGRTYRYMEQKPQFPFGFGLSYSTFKYADLKLTTKKGTVDVEATIENTGSVAGTEVVQLYVSSPLAGKGDPFSSLKSFEKVDLQPGEKKAVVFELDRKAFVQYENDGQEVIRKGEYTLKVAGASPGERSESLGAPMLTSAGINARKIFK
ncbi:glycoside hydrolase family 3 protein [Fulvivirga sp. M361]|nr:glycoside hydrolase family 3 protein [Fulvivirga sp. M361]